MSTDEERYKNVKNSFDELYGYLTTLKTDAINEDWKKRICDIQKDLREDEHVKHFDKLLDRLDNLKTEAEKLPSNTYGEGWVTKFKNALSFLKTYKVAYDQYTAHMAV